MTFDPRVDMRIRYRPALPATRALPRIPNNHLLFNIYTQHTDFISVGKQQTKIYLARYLRRGGR